MLERLNEYAHKLQILRQIQSNKAQKYSKINTWQNITTVAVSSLITFIGFSGVDKIHVYANWIVAAEKAKVEFAFNLAVFLLFVLVILHLVFRFPDKQAQGERAVVSLTNLINEIDDLLSRSNRLEANVLDMVRYKYESLIQVIPPNSDKEFLRAKADYKQKKAKGINPPKPADLFDSAHQLASIEAIIAGSELTTKVLITLRDTNETLFLAGSLVRNLIWDYLHGYRSSTQVDDVDVLHFDDSDATKRHDELIEARLHKQFPNIRWSVKNQARMHTINGDSPYSSIDDAVSKFPDTPSAFAVRMKDDGSLQVVAPIGFDDLFRLIVAPTPHFRSKIDRYKQRIDSKKWQVTWPRLKILEA